MHCVNDTHGGEAPAKMPGMAWRQALRHGAGAALCAALLVLPAAQAAEYPARPVDLIVGFPPGGPTDVVARLISEHLTTDLHEKFIVENKAGASGDIATKNAARSKADGYTGLVASLNLTINPFMGSGIDVDSRKNLVPVRTVAVAPTVLVVNRDFPATNVKEFLDAVRKEPNRYNASSQGPSSLLAAEMFSQQTGLNITPIPYKGAAPAMVDLVAGHVQLSFATLGSVLPHIRSGKIRVLAVASPQRDPLLPGTPTFAESGMPDFRFDSWTGLVMPAGTPQAVIDTLARSLDKLAHSPAFEKQLAVLGMTPVLNDSPQSFAKTIDSELTLYEKLAIGARRKTEH
jgi:tripartite-type tricarboxylate transporter receptor subunit TctC